MPYLRLIGALVYLGICQALYRHTDNPVSMTGAHDECHAPAEHLPLPSGVAANEELTSYLADKDVAATWLAAQIVPTYYHNVADGSPFNDQGCYRKSDIEWSRPTFDTHHVTYAECSNVCRDYNQSFVGFQSFVHSNASKSFRCACAVNVQVFKQLPERDCQETCDRSLVSCGSDPLGTVRVYATGAMPAVYWTESTEINNASFCAARSHAAQTLTRQPCSEELRVKCDVGDGQYLSDVGTWFEGRMRCEKLSGRIASNGFGWSNIIAVEWRDPDGSSRDVTFTHWARGHPDLDVGSCVVISRDGLWKTANCSINLNPVCHKDSQGIGSFTVVVAAVGSVVGLLFVSLLAGGLIMHRKSHSASLHVPPRPTPDMTPKSRSTIVHCENPDLHYANITPLLI